MMSDIKSLRMAVISGSLSLIVSMSSHGDPTSAATVTTSSEPFVWPASFAPLGNGYPNEGDACRRLGESPATADYLDHTATLIGCPGGAESASARAILTDYRAHVVGRADGVTLISISSHFRRRE